MKYLALVLATCAFNCAVLAQTPLRVTAGHYLLTRKSPTSGRMEYQTIAPENGKALGWNALGLPIAIDVAGGVTTWADVTGKPTFATVATTGAYADLTGKLVIGTDVLAPNGVGTALTALNASNLASGTIPDARFPATLPALSGANLTALNASNLSSGTITSTRLPAPTTTTLGAVKRNTGSAGEFVTGVDASGNLLYATPAGSGGSAPAGTGTELQYRVNGSTLGAVTRSSVSGAGLFLGGDENSTTAPTTLLTVQNTTAATAGVPAQHSPVLRLSGTAYKNTVTTGSQTVSFDQNVATTGNLAAPRGTWALKSSVGGGAYATWFSADTANGTTVGMPVAFSSVVQASRKFVFDETQFLFMSAGNPSAASVPEFSRMQSAAGNFVRKLIPNNAAGATTAAYVPEYPRYPQFVFTMPTGTPAFTDFILKCTLNNFTEYYVFLMSADREAITFTTQIRNDAAIFVTLAQPSTDSRLLYRHAATSGSIAANLPTGSRVSSILVTLADSSLANLAWNTDAVWEVLYTNATEARSRLDANGNPVDFWEVVQPAWVYNFSYTRTNVTDLTP